MGDGYKLYWSFPPFSNSLDYRVYNVDRNYMNSRYLVKDDNRQWLLKGLQERENKYKIQ